MGTSVESIFSLSNSGVNSDQTESSPMGLSEQSALSPAPSNTKVMRGSCRTFLPNFSHLFVVNAVMNNLRVTLTSRGTAWRQSRCVSPVGLAIAALNIATARASFLHQAFRRLLCSEFRFGQILSKQS